MANPLRAARCWDTIAQIQAHVGSQIEDWAHVRELGALFRWVVGSTLTADSFSVLTHSGGTDGRWIRQRMPTLGTVLTDADATIYVTGKTKRVLPAGTLTDNRTATLGTTNAASGDEMTIVRRDTGAYTLAVVNGGVGAGTLCTMPVSAAYWADFYFDGTNWSLLRGGALPT